MEGLRLGLIGDGRMGQEIARLAPEKGHRVVATFDRARRLEPGAPVQGIEVFIDFSHPAAVLDHVRALAGVKAGLVIGTTGWYEQLGEIRELVAKTRMGVVYAPNFSIGVSVFLRIVEAAAGLFDALENYDVFLHETHHRGKVDSPSGTALALADTVLNSISRKTELRTDASPGPVAPGQLQIASSRGGAVPGCHSVFFDSGADTIELRHVARNRSGFALGALRAAEWIQGKTGVHSFREVLEDVFGAAR